jgi:hypothetical protein
VIAGKDVEKAIADRAEWRADERRRCRQGSCRGRGGGELTRGHGDWEME